MVTAGPGPRVSVIIATFNWSAALRCAIRSVLRQTVQDFEVLVMGDACTDDSADVVASFQDPRLSWHNLVTHGGSQSGPNNEGLRRARGEWIAYLGHDDLWHPSHLESTLRAATGAGAEMAAGVTILYGPPGSGVRAVTGVFAGDTYRPTDFIPPSSLLHRRRVIEGAAFWRDPATTVWPVDWAFVRDAVQSGARLVPTNEVSVFKFNAAWRRHSYRLRATTEQEAMLARLDRDPDLRHHELVGVLQAMAGGSLHAITLPPDGTVAPGALAARNRRFKGVEARFDPAACRRLERAERFRIGDELDGFEWHREEIDATHGPFRWTGPATSSTIELPVLRDRALEVRVLVLRAIQPDLMDSLTATAGGEPLAIVREPRPDGSCVVHCTMPPANDRLGPATFSLTLTVARTARPCDLGLNEDTRRLGLAVAWVEIS